MAKKPAIRVALDLETTGLHHEQDAILEIAAIKFQGTEIIDTFETFVAPGRSIPYRVQRLTGIKPEHLVGAPPFSAIAKRLQTFLDDYPIVGHSIPFDVGFLRLRGLAHTNPLVDTFELATVLLPSLASYNLGQVAHSLGVRVPHDRHRAMVDTVLAMEVFLALHQRLANVDLALLNDLANLDAPRSWPLLHFFRQELRDRQDQAGVHGSLGRGSLGDRFAAQLGMDPRVLSFSIARQQDAPGSELTVQPSPLPSIPEPADARLEQVQTLVEETNEISRDPVKPHGYTTTREAMRRALEERSPLLLDVATGGSDYTLALLPVLEWLAESPSAAEQAPRRLVIACASQQSARRLMETTLPRLQATLQCQFPIAYLAERGGYLCTHRWFGAALRRTSGELTAEQARGLAKLGLWAYQTESGERSEITLLQQEMSAWDRISSGVERIPSTDSRTGTSYQRCNYRRKGYCFVSRAEDRVRDAQIVVTTHAGLFDDLSYSHSLLKSIEARLVLDADLLEEENARWSGSDFDKTRLLAQLATVGTELPNGRYQGLLALAAPALRENGPGGLSKTPTIAKAELDARLLTWFQTLRQARTAVEKLFGSFSRLIEEYVQQGANGKGRGDTPGRAHGHGGRGSERTDQPLRLNHAIRHLAAWIETEQAWQQASQRLQIVIDLAREAEKLLVSPQGARRPLDLGSGDESSVAAELVATAHKLSQQKELLQYALELGNSDTVYWLRMPPTPSFAQNTPRPGEVQSEPTPVLYSQLVQTSALLKNLLLKEQSCTIFAGTALAVDNSFSFSRHRFGLDHEQSAAISISTEHHEQTLFYLPDDVPEPNAPQYQRHLDEALIQLATTLEGQLVALFTSHASLRSSYAAIKPILEGRGILVLGQGIDGSPRQLWQVFQSQEHVVLLGTGSFWDGTEDIEHPPACLIVTRLPMPVLNDPPIAARAEQYSDQLHHFTVPIAAQRMRRTLNRLAWGDKKRNAIVLFDRRIVSKEYGSMVLHSLPRCSQKQGSVSQMSESVLDWLTGSGAWEDTTP
jgi:ATP-dependent DNA helicase DinG